VIQARSRLKRRNAILGLMLPGNDDLLSEVSRILWEPWDPIGVNDEPGAFGEYDSYAAPIVSRLLRGTTVADIDSYLAGVKTLSMGLRERPSTSRAKAVSLLLALRVAAFSG
jgi:hypothetical protein